MIFSILLLQKQKNTNKMKTITTNNENFSNVSLQVEKTAKKSIIIANISFFAFIIIIASLIISAIVLL